MNINDENEVELANISSDEDNKFVPIEKKRLTVLNYRIKFILFWNVIIIIIIIIIFVDLFPIFRFSFVPTDFHSRKTNPRGYFA